ncbi:hypothetical protein ACFSC4_29425 [Deinococcus malanensis]|uniref:hypothetical protein n=1 Tax=Deinococcus malanensis TaxID=1706855 RepID=UPI0036431D41
MPKRFTPVPKYRQLYPETLATADELKALGLKPGASTPVALLEYTRPRTPMGSAPFTRGIKRYPSQRWIPRRKPTVCTVP